MARKSLLLDCVGSIFLLHKHPLIHHLPHERLRFLGSHELAFAAGQLQLKLSNLLISRYDGL